MKFKKAILIGIVAGILVSLLFELTALGARLAGRSDALWWQLLPWFLLVVFWAVLLMQVRRTRRAEAEKDV